MSLTVQDALRQLVEPDARTGELSSTEVTLSATPGTVTSIDIPDTARRVRIYPRTNHVRFAIGEAPAAVGTNNTFGTGGIAKADAWEERLLEEGTGRTLQLRSTTASVVVDVEAY